MQAAETPGGAKGTKVAGYRFRGTGRANGGHALHPRGRRPCEKAAAIDCRSAVPIFAEHAPDQRGGAKGAGGPIDFVFQVSKGRQHPSSRGVGPFLPSARRGDANRGLGAGP